MIFLAIFEVIAIAALQTEHIEAHSLRAPDFVSQWFYIESITGKDVIDVYHHLGEVPALVNVQVRSTTPTNNGFIFPGIGVVPSDVDLSDPFSGVVYIYNERKVTVSALTVANDVRRGRIIYTENSTFWEGPNSDSTYTAYVRVRAWRTSTLPKPDFNIKDQEINSACGNKTGCFYELRHGLDEYPSMVIVRTRLSSPKFACHGFMSDAVGAALTVREKHSSHGKTYGFVIYGFDNQSIRIWTHSNGYIFEGKDSYGLTSYFTSGHLEIMAWKNSTLRPYLIKNIQLNEDLENYTEVPAATENLLVNLWAEAEDGSNSGYRFPGSGSLSYFSDSGVQASPCNFGGLTFAYTNESIRLWTPRNGSFGNIICIPSIYGGGNHTQGSNHVAVKLHIWIPHVSVLNWNCTENEDCYDENSKCVNSACHCVDDVCHKDLTCSDTVPVLPELERRARNYIIDPNSTLEQFIDDSNLKSSWYKVSPGKTFLMPDNSSEFRNYSCGTTYQYYINGSHPRLENLTEVPIQLSVCYGDCQKVLDVMVKVRKCPDDSVHYRLGPLPLQSAYCFDPPEISEMNVSALDLVRSLESILRLDVTLRFEEQEGPNATIHLPYLTFNCSMDGQLPNETSPINYTTYWYINNRVFLVLGPSPVIENLTEQMLLERNQSLGVNISCGVKLSSAVTSLMKSPEIFYGIKVHNPVVTLNKGKTVVIKLETTAPIGCMYQNATEPQACKHKIYLVRPNKYDGDSVGIVNTKQGKLHDGMFEIYTSNGIWPVGEVHTIEITTEDQNYAHGHQFFLTFELADHGHQIWEKHQINVMVNVTFDDSYQYKHCYAHVDPHMQTADGYLYEHQFQGEFILYRNLKYDIEVQMKTGNYYQGRIWCACSVAVRAGGDVFLIYLCHKQTFIGFTSCNNGGILDVRNPNAYLYQVYTPIGSIINLHILRGGYESFINVEVYMSTGDIGNTDGLCGYFDYNKDNDLMKRPGSTEQTSFSMSWRLNENDTYYVLGKLEIVANKSQCQGTDLLFSCDNTTVLNDTESEESATVCSPKVMSNSPHKQSITKQSCEAIGKKSIPNFDKMKDDPSQGKDVCSQTGAGTHKSPITMDQAKQICFDFINSLPAVRDFADRLKGIDMAKIVDECAFDVFELNCPKMADIYSDIVNQAIMTYNIRDTKYVETHQAEVNQFNALSCPSNCSGNGKCTSEGVCSCFPHLHGPDCGINENKKLDIHVMKGSEFCVEGSGRDCRCIEFQTRNLLKQFSCKVTEKLRLANGSELAIRSYVGKSTYYNIYNGECCATKSRRKRSDYDGDVLTKEIRIAVSNNGLNYSSESKMVICQAVNKDMPNNAACLISGYCRAENETMSSDNCFVCLPHLNKYDWTNTCPVNQTVNMGLVGAILGVVGGLLALLIIAAVVCVMKRQKKKSISDSCLFDEIAPRAMQYKYKRPKVELFYAQKALE